MNILGIGARLPRQFTGFVTLLMFWVGATEVAPSLSSQTNPSMQFTTTQTVSGPALSTSDYKPSQEELGDLHMLRKRYQAAIAAYQQEPQKSAVIWNKIGIASQQMFMLDEAKKSYDKSLKLNPKNAEVINNLGTIYYSQKQYGAAEHMYRKAIKLKPKSALIYKNLGTVLLAKHKFKKGWECYQAALSLDPEVFETTATFRVGDPTSAQRRGAVNYYLAKSYLGAGMRGRAVEYLRMALDEGFIDRKKVMADKEFASLRGDAAFELLLAEQSLR